MASGPEHDIQQLDSLIRITLESARNYKGAAEASGSSRSASLFRDRSTQRFDIAERLRARVRSLGGDTEKSGSELIDNPNQKLTGTDASIAAVEAGEDRIRAAYRQVITDVELSDPVRMAVESEFAQIQAAQDDMSKLKHGVD